MRRLCRRRGRRVIPRSTDGRASAWAGLDARVGHSRGVRNPSARLGRPPVPRPVVCSIGCGGAVPTAVRTPTPGSPGPSARWPRSPTPAVGVGWRSPCRTSRRSPCWPPWCRRSAPAGPACTWPSCRRASTAAGRAKAHRTSPSSHGLQSGWGPSSGSARCMRPLQEEIEGPRVAIVRWADGHPTAAATALEEAFLLAAQRLARRRR